MTTPKFRDASSVRQAFEIEDVRTRQNFVYEWDPENQKSIMWNTSRGVGKKFYAEDTKVTAWETFKANYTQAMKNPLFPFLWWVDPETMAPLDQMEYEEDETNES